MGFFISEFGVKFFVCERASLKRHIWRLIAVAEKADSYLQLPVRSANTHTSWRIPKLDTLQHLLICLLLLQVLVLSSPSEQKLIGHRQRPHLVYILLILTILWCYLRACLLQLWKFWVLLLFLPLLLPKFAHFLSTWLFFSLFLLNCIQTPSLFLSVHQNNNIP